MKHEMQIGIDVTIDRVSDEIMDYLTMEGTQAATLSYVRFDPDRNEFQIKVATGPKVVIKNGKISFT